MNPKTLTLRGAIGIRAGLNRDEITIEVAGVIPADAVTVAIKGDNGMGKSTLLNLGMSPWLNPPQLPGSMYDHFGDDGERVLEWEHGGELYRSTIHYRQTKKAQSTKAFLHVRNNGEWVPVTLPDHTASDGKAGTYNACLEAVLGSQSVYYLSAFRAQNAPRLADYDDPKGLMRDLLHLDEPNALAEQAAKVRLQLERAAGGIEEEAAGLDAKRTRAGVIEIEIPGIEQAVTDCRTARRDATEAHARAKSEYDRAVSEGLDQERIREARGKLEARIAGLQQGHTTEIKRINRGRDATRQRGAAIIKGAERTRDQIASDLAAAKKRIARSGEILGRANEIRGATKDLETLTRLSTEMEGKAGEWRTKIEIKRQAAIGLTDIVHTLAAVIQEERVLRGRQDDMERRASLTKQALFGDKCTPCPLLSDAIQAAKSALTTDAARKDKLGEYHTIDARRSAAEAAFAAMGDPDAEYRILQGKQHKLNQQITEARSVAALLPALQGAQEDIEQAKQQLVDLAERLAIANGTEATDRRQIDAEIKTLNDAESEINRAFQAHTAAEQKELDALPPADEADAVDHAKGVLRKADDALNESSADLEGCSAKLAQRRAERDTLAREISDGASVTERAAYLQEEIAHWRRLTAGLHGVVDLSIEDAGPGIAEIANRLLREAYGPRFTVRIVTQRQNKTNGILKEVFDISVIDAETGLEASIVHKSGGEAVWLDKALTDAVGLYHQDAAGMRFGTLFADEAEDGLTAERKQQFYAMDRAALELGGYERKFFVSHNPDAWALADAVIDLSEYRMTA